MPKPVHKRIYDDHTACMKVIRKPNQYKDNPRIKSSFMWPDVTCEECLKHQDNGAINFLARMKNQKTIRRPCRKGLLSGAK